MRARPTAPILNNGAARRGPAGAGLQPAVDRVLDEIGVWLRHAVLEPAAAESSLTAFLENLRPALLNMVDSAAAASRQRLDELTAVNQCLEAERQRYQELFEAAPDGYLVTDADGIIREANRAASRLLHLSRAHLLGRALVDFVAREERVALADLLARLHHGEQAPACELRMRPRGRALFPAALTLAPFRDPAGQLLGFRGLVRDVTERKRAEEEVARQHQRLQQVLDAVQAQIWYLDLEGRVVRHNVFAERMTGLNADQVVGGTVGTLAPYWDDPERRHQESLHVARTGVPLLGSLESFTWKNETRWARVDKVPARDGSGNVVGVLVFIYDVTDLKRTEEALRRSEARMRAILDTAMEAILAVDEGGCILSANKSAEAVFGYAADQLMGQSIRHLLPGPAAADTADGSESCPFGLAQAPGTSRECQARRHDEIVFPVQVTLSTPWDHGRRLTCIVRDITQEKEAQERALQAERLAAIGQMMTGLAHESRNALQRCQASLEMLALELRGRQALKHVGEIQKSCDDLFQLYEEVRGYASPMRLKRQTCDLADVLYEAWAQLADLRRDRDVRLREQRDTADLRVVADRFRLVQVFRNILANAIEACANPVLLEVVWSDAALPGVPALRTVIRDNGPGLSAAQQQRIFEPFFTTKDHGTGLGMAITRRIVEAHGGKINAAAAPQGGAAIEMVLARGC